PYSLRPVGSTLFFGAWTPAQGDELWKTDGTTAGTVLLKDIVPGSPDSFPSHLTDVGATLFFAAFDTTNGTELWKSDGTSGGTTVVKDIWPGGSDGDPDG